MTRHLVIEFHGVVPHGNRAGTRHLRTDVRCKIMFGNAQLFRFLRCDAGDEAGSGFRQVVHRRTTVPDIRLIREKVEIHVGAPTRKLHGAIQPLIQTERFIVVPINRRDCFGSHVGMSKKRECSSLLYTSETVFCVKTMKKIRRTAFSLKENRPADRKQTITANQAILE